MGIVQGCTSREKNEGDSDKKFIKFDLQGFQENAFDDENGPTNKFRHCYFILMTKA